MLLQEGASVYVLVAAPDPREHLVPAEPEPNSRTPSGLQSDEPIKCGCCPACGRTLTDGAVVCVQCGFDRRTGGCLQTLLERSHGAPAVPGIFPAPGASPASLRWSVACLVILASLGGLAYLCAGLFSGYHRYPAREPLIGKVFVLVFLALACGLLARARLAYWITRSAMLALLGVAPVVLLAQHLAKPSGMWAEYCHGMRGIVLAAASVICFLAAGIVLVLLDRRAAQTYFGLTCPVCGTTRGRSLRHLFARVSCRSCDVTWQEEPQEPISRRGSHRPRAIFLAVAALLVGALQVGNEVDNLQGAIRFTLHNAGSGYPLPSSNVASTVASVMMLASTAYLLVAAASSLRRRTVAGDMASASMFLWLLAQMTILLFVLPGLCARDGFAMDPADEARTWKGLVFWRAVYLALTVLSGLLSLSLWRRMAVVQEAASDILGRKPLMKTLLLLGTAIGAVVVGGFACAQLKLDPQAMRQVAALLTLLILLAIPIARLTSRALEDPPGALLACLPTALSLAAIAYFGAVKGRVGVTFMLATAGVTALTVVWLFRYSSPTLLAQLQLRPVRVIHLLPMLMVGVTWIFAAGVINQEMRLLQYLIDEKLVAKLNDMTRALARAQGAWGWCEVALSLAIVPALVEEFFFRGLLFQALRQRFSFSRTALITAVLFAVAHLDPLGSPAYFVLGFVFALVVQWTGSLWWAVGLHALNNLAAVILSNAYAPAAEFPMSLTTSGLLLLAGVAGGVASLVWLYRQAGAGGGRNGPQSMCTSTTNAER